MNERERRRVLEAIHLLDKAQDIYHYGNKKRYRHDDHSRAGCPTCVGGSDVCRKGAER
jgi:hypothetical protein